MKNIIKHSALLFAVLVVSAFVAQAQSTSSPAKQETTQQVAPEETFFRIESLDNARNKTEQAYLTYQSAPKDKADALGADFRALRRLYIVELERNSGAYPSDSETGLKIHSELVRVSKDLR